MSELPMSTLDGSGPQPVPGRDRRTVLVAAGLLGVLALGGGAYLLLGSGGSDDLTATVVPTRTFSTVTPTPTPIAGAGTIPAAASLPQGRNPFKALIVASAGGGPAAGSSPAPSSAPTGVTTPSLAPTPTASDSPVSTTTYKITLNAFGQLLGDARSMSWTVDGVRKSVLVGQRFGKSGELAVLTVKSVNGASQAVLQIGDAAPRSIGVGATIDVL